MSKRRTRLLLLSLYSIPFVHPAITIAAEPLGDCAIPEAVVIASDPPEGGTLCKTNKNVIRLTFDSPLPFTPAAGDILIQEVLPDETLGPDLSASFLFTVEPDNKLKIKDSGFTLLNLRWYAISNSAPCDGIEDFRVDLFTLRGDVNGDGRVQQYDVALVWGNTPRVGTTDDNRFDVDSTTHITTVDLLVTNSYVPAERPPLDCEPRLPASPTANVEFEPKCYHVGYFDDRNLVTFTMKLRLPPSPSASADIYLSTDGLPITRVVLHADFLPNNSVYTSPLPFPLPCLSDNTWYFGRTGFPQQPGSATLTIGEVTVDTRLMPVGIYELRVDSSADGGRSRLSDLEGENITPLYGKGSLSVGPVKLLYATSSPSHNSIMHKSRRNNLILAVDHCCIAPEDGRFTIREMLPEGQYGPELIDNFAVYYESGMLVELTNMGTPLKSQTWYAVGNIDPCDMIGDNLIHFQVLIGDADGDGNVNLADMDFVNAGIPAINVPHSNPRDINNDGNVNFADLAAMNPHIGDRLVPKPSGHE